MSSSSRRAPLALVVFIEAALVAAGCGSKPEYCQDVTNFKTSVDTLADISLQGGFVAKFQTDLDAVKTNANAVVASAKADFPTETSALQNSVNAPQTSITKLSDGATPQQVITIASQVSGVVSAAKNLQSATSGACK